MRLSACITLALLATTAAAQTPESPSRGVPEASLASSRSPFGAERRTPALPPEAVVREAVAIAPTDWGAVGFGPDYDVEFEAGEVRFLPVGASRGAGSLTLRLESIALGEHVLHHTDGPRDPVLGDDSVSYSLGSLGEERYTLRRDGVKQDVILCELPAASGDLVVRMRIATDLGAGEPAPGTGALVFSGPAGGGVAVGEVIGLDADGRSVTGVLRRSGDVLESVLPAAFVASAALPLVVDPVISSHWVYPSPGGSISVRPDAAFAASQQAFGVVWMRRIGSATAVCFAPVHPSGALFAPAQIVDVTTDPISAPAVIADIDEGEAFVVAWAQEFGSKTDHIHLRRLRAPTPSGPWLVDREAALTAKPGVDSLDLGGAVDDRALVVWGDDAHDIYSQLVWPTSESYPIGFLSKPKVWLDEDSEYGDTRPRVSHCRSLRLIVWERRRTTDIDVYGRVVLGNGSAFGAPTPIFDDPSLQERLPATAGLDDFVPALGVGEVYTVVAQRYDGESTDVAAKQVSLYGWCPIGTLCVDPATLVLDVVGPGSSAILGPVIGQAGPDSYVVHWERKGAAGWNVYGASLRRRVLEISEPAYEIAPITSYEIPNVSDNDHPTTKYNLVVFTDAYPGLPANDTRGAIVEAMP